MSRKIFENIKFSEYTFVDNPVEGIFVQHETMECLTFLDYIEDASEVLTKIVQHHERYHG